MLGRKKVDFKGTKNGIVLYYEKDLSFEELCDLIEKKLNKAKDFFKGAHMIGIDGPPLALEQEEKLTSIIERQSGMKVLTLEPLEKGPKKEDVTGIFKMTSQEINFNEVQGADDQASEVQGTEVSEAGVGVGVGAEVVDVLPLLGDLALGDKTVFHTGTLRSGKRIESQGHLIVIGDVNPGAEVSAQGNIVVLGTLRGFAYAGASGDDTRMIIALKLMPTQLRIGSKITRSPDDGTSAPSYPEVARVKNNQIIIEPLT